MQYITSTPLDLQRLIGRAMVDAAFRAELIENPIQVAEREGLSLTADEAAKLSRIDQFAGDQISERQGTESFWS